MMSKEHKLTFTYSLRESINRVAFWISGFILVFFGIGYVLFLFIRLLSGEIQYEDLDSELPFGILLLFVASILGFIPFTNSLGTVSYCEEGLHIRAYFSFRRWIRIPWEKVICIKEIYEGTKSTTLIFVENATIWHSILGLMCTGKKQPVTTLKDGLQERGRLEQLIQEKLSANDRSESS